MRRNVAFGALVVAVAAALSMPADGYRHRPTPLDEYQLPAPAPVLKACQGDAECWNNQVCVHAGPCGKDGNPGWCQDRPTCPKVESLVCGCDGHMYLNQCEARAHGVDVVADDGCIPRLRPCPPQPADLGHTRKGTRAAACKCATGDFGCFARCRQCTSGGPFCLESCGVVVQPPCGR